MTAITTSKCRLLGCGFEASYTDAAMSRRVLSEHLSTSHGVGSSRGAEAHVGCFFGDCGFKVSGSAALTRDLLRDHLISVHKIDPENPEIPENARRGER